jgi:hypothetical protein
MAGDLPNETRPQKKSDLLEGNASLLFQLLVFLGIPVETHS